MNRAATARLDRKLLARSSICFRMKLFARLMFPLLIGLAFSGVGCSKPEPIRRYEVAKPPHRMLAAILPIEKEAWFFKLSGPRKEVGELQGAFDGFLKSIEIDGAASPPKPKWELPTGWKQLPGSEERYATIEIPQSEKPLELTVTRLPIPDSDWDAYRLQNVNRWRMQVRLGPIDFRQLADEVVELTGKTGKPITRVDLVGTMSNSRRPSMAGMAGMGRAGMGPMAGGPASGGQTSADDAPDDSGSNPFVFEAPSSWKPGGKRPFVRLAFRIESNDGNGEVTVSSLVAASNDLLSNVNRWRGQLKLPELTADELAKAVQPISLGGVDGAYVELVGEGPGRETILGVMAVHGEDAWFFKFKGPGKLAEQEKAQFEAFVKSVRFKG